MNSNASAAYPAPPPPVASAQPRAPAAAWYVLAALSFISLVSFADRYVLLLLTEPIRAFFSLNDLEVGLLQGTGVALFAAAASYPLGWLAGRYDNRIVLALCIMVWSMAVALSGLAQNFTQIFVFSALVSAAEAGLSPISYSLIPRLFSGAQRQAANSIFAATAIGGGALAIFLAGTLIEMTPALQPLLPAAVATLEPWRVSLLLAACAAPVMIVIAITLPIGKHRKPPQPTANGATAPREAAFWPYLWQHRAVLIPTLVGSALAGMAFGAIGPWIAIGATRIFGASPAEVGAGMGLAQAASAISAFLLSLLVTRFALPRYGAVAPALVLAATAAGMLVCTLALPFVHTAEGLYVFFGVFGLFLSMGAMFQPTVYQTIVPIPMIGRIVAVQFISTMLGAAAVGPMVGATSDALAADGSALIMAMTMVAVPTLVVAAGLLQMARGPRFHRAREDAEAINAAELQPLSA